MSKLSITCASLQVLAMVVMCVALIYTIFLAKRDKRSEFWIKLCSLLYAIDCSVILLSLLYAAEDTHILEGWLAFFIGLCNCVFNSSSNLVHWAFAFKYHIISREIPKSIIGIVDHDAVKRYKYANYVAIVVCLGLGIYAGVVRGLYATQITNKQLAREALLGEILCTVWQLICGIILTEAIFMIRK
jgi:hypothetical protein